jgi:hypothetical protein
VKVVQKIAIIRDIIISPRSMYFYYLVSAHSL